MFTPSALLLIFSFIAYTLALPHQRPFAAPSGVGHFSEWSAQTKASFLKDVSAGNAANWTIVMGNEGGDLDSMAAAFTWAYHLGHVDPSRPAIGLLQTPEDALDLRPENKLALLNIKMSPGHSDLLTIDELPLSPKELAPLLRGIVLVDHPTPLSVWENATVLSIFDHHLDRGSCPDAHPRVFFPTASCSTLVGKQMLDEIEKLPEGEYHLPHELLELLLSAIAIDSKGLQSRSATPTDKFVSSRLFRRSNWSDDSLYEKMAQVADVLKDAKKDLDGLSVRDLLRRDWKGGIVQTPRRSPDIHLGYASIPYSLSRQAAERTPNGSLAEWFAIERNWTSEIRADATVALMSYKRASGDDQASSQDEDEEMWLEDDDDEDEDEDPLHISAKIKERQIVIVVRSDHRISESQADSLFEKLRDSIASSEVLFAKPWHRSDELGPRQAVFTHSVPNGGRKLIRPIIESACMEWQG